MAMNVCPTCGYKVISNEMFKRHLATHVVDPVVEPVTVEVPMPEVPVDNDITIRFSKDVEIQINSIHYFGKVIKVKDMSVASEIVRIAREAYGPTILL
jgi:hypothetical protein